MCVRSKPVERDGCLRLYVTLNSSVLPSTSVLLTVVITACTLVLLAIFCFGLVGVEHGSTGETFDRCGLRAARSFTNSLSLSSHSRPFFYFTACKLGLVGKHISPSSVLFPPKYCKETLIIIIIIILSAYYYSYHGNHHP